MNKVRVGLCGLGFMGAAHLQGYSKIREAEVVAVCHASAKRFGNQAVGNLKGIVGGSRIGKNTCCYQSLTDMLDAEDLDLVDICTPTHTHSVLACDAFEAGAHVLCEK